MPLHFIAKHSAFFFCALAWAAFAACMWLPSVMRETPHFDPGGFYLLGALIGIVALAVSLTEMWEWEEKKAK